MSTVTNRFNIHQSQRWFVANTDGVHFVMFSPLIRRIVITDGNVQEGTTRPDEHLRHRERRTLVEQGLAGLPELYSRALSMHCLGERSYHEITRELHISLGTLKVWLFRARAKLRKEFEKAGLESHVL